MSAIYKVLTAGDGILDNLRCPSGTSPREELQYRAVGVMLPLNFAQMKQELYVLVNILSCRYRIKSHNDSLFRPLN